MEEGKSRSKMPHWRFLVLSLPKSLNFETNKKAIYWEKYARWLIILLAAGLCFYQFFTLTGEYLRMEVTHTITLDIPQKVKIPGVTLSVHTTPLIHYKRLLSRRPDIGSYLQKRFNVTDEESFASFLTTNGNYLEGIIEKTSTVKDLFKMIYRPEEFAKIEAIVSPEDGELIANVSEDICGSKQYLRNGKLWFSYFCFYGQHNLVHTKDLIENHIPYLKLLLIDHELFRRVKTVQVYLHAPQYIIRNWRIMSATLTWEKTPNTRQLSYHRYEVNLLKAPYETDCVDYREDSFKSRYHEIEQCEYDLAKKEFGFTFPENTRFPDDDSLVGPSSYRYVYGGPYGKRVHNGDKQFLHEARKIWHTCEQRYFREECSQEYFVPIIQPSVDIYSHEYTALAIRPSIEPEIIKTAKPSTTFTSYLTLACSIFAFWFNFSVAGSLLDLLPVISQKELIKKVKGMVLDSRPSRCEPQLKRFNSMPCVYESPV